MARIDFYHLTRDPVEKILPAIAQKVLDGGARLLVVTNAAERLSEAFWRFHPASFLAHGMAEAEDAAIQPILLSALTTAANGATHIALANGIWDDAALGFERIFFLFLPDQIDAARGTWRNLKAMPDHECHYWKQDGGKWVEAG